MVVYRVSKFTAQHHFSQHAADLLRGGIRVALADTADSQGFNHLVEVAHQREFFPGWHTPDDFDLELFDPGVSIGVILPQRFWASPTRVNPKFIPCNLEKLF